MINLERQELGKTFSNKIMLRKKKGLTLSETGGGVGTSSKGWGVILYKTFGSQQAEGGELEDKEELFGGDGGETENMAVTGFHHLSHHKEIEHWRQMCWWGSTQCCLCHCALIIRIIINGVWIVVRVEFLCNRWW